MVLADELDEQLLGTVWEYNLVKKRDEIQTNSLMMPFILYAILSQRGGRMARPKIQFQFELVLKEAILHKLHPQKHVFIGTNFYFVGRNGTVICICLFFVCIRAYFYRDNQCTLFSIFPKQIC